MNVTTKQMRIKPYGTPCGTVGENDTSLTHDLVIKFIDTFFGGSLENVEVYKDEDSDSLLIAGGQPILKKLEITNDEFDYFTLGISKEFRKDFIENVSEFLDLRKSKFKNIEKVNKDYHPEIICWLFSNLVGNYGGSFRCDYMDDGNVDLESE